MVVDEASNKQSPSISVSSKKKKKKEEDKEGSFLLGSPNFKDIGDGRLRCEETGHELPAKERDTYARSKACHFVLIDAAVAGKKPPLNMFQQCPLSKVKLVCKLTGDTINKSEEHIWKHITGKRFNTKLEQKEVEKVSSPEKVEKKLKKSKKLWKSSIDASEEAQKMEANDNILSEENHVQENNESEEPEFWAPPVGERWDFDDGKDRWEACTPSDQEKSFEGGTDEGNEQQEVESMELSMRTKRMSIAVGPSSFASRKKKAKKNPDK